MGLRKGGFKISYRVIALLPQQQRLKRLTDYFMKIKLEETQEVCCIACVAQARRADLTLFLKQHHDKDILHETKNLLNQT